MREPRDIWAIRQAVQRWPLPRGRGIPQRLARGRLARRDFPVVLGPGAVIAPELDDWIVRHAFEGGHLRDPAFRYAFAHLRGGDLAIDVGANVGTWSLPAAQRVGQLGRVWAFEAVPQTADRLLRNWELSGRPPQLTIEKLAASDIDGGIAVMHHGSHTHSAASSIRGLSWSHDAVEVPSVRLDAYWRRAGAPPVRLLKIDVEGAEARVLSGALDLLMEAGPIVVFECDSAFLGETSSSPEAILALLAGCGYRTFRLDRGRTVPVSVAPTYHCDLVALKEP